MILWLAFKSSQLDDQSKRTVCAADFQAIILPTNQHVRGNSSSYLNGSGLYRTLDE
ncbi:hypothetical protein KP509_1Z136600 [Ceratopteris richardii]|nr:hypothetical protein KP509_1Z136600 [Ceratopteris richardii]